MKIVSKLLACSVGLFAGAQLQAATNAISDPVGFFKVNIFLGSTVISAPMQPLATYRGTVASVSGTNITFAGNPNFTVGQFNRVTNGASLFNQYIVIVRQDINPTSLVPTGVATNNITGDWWSIIETPNSSTVAVNPMSDVLSTTLQAGDVLEIRKLTTLADLVGPPGPGSVMNTNGNSNFEAGGGDAIKFFNGLGSGGTIVNKSSVSEYHIGGQNLSNGTTFTFEPNEAFFYKRVDHTAVGKTAATNLVSLGQVQTLPLTQYFTPGPNVFSTQFPADQTYINTGLKDLILLAGAASANNFFAEGTEDGIKEFATNGLGSTASVVYSLATGAFQAGGTAKNNSPLVPGQSYIYYVKPGTGGRVWRQPVPFTP